MIVRVTANHIKRGIARSLCACPIALALEPLFPKGTVVWVFKTWVSKNRTGGFDLPLAAVEFITKFDDGAPVEPFEFELPEVPTSC